MENVKVSIPIVAGYTPKTQHKIFKMPVLNRIAIAGKLVQDPPIRWTKRGVPVTNFIVATRPEPGSILPEGVERESCFVSVVAWSKQAVQCNKYLKKGSSVLILGELQSMPNSEPNNEFFPVQLSAQWIQYLEKDSICTISGYDDMDYDSSEEME